jgi:hypothetical protein
MKLKIIPMAPLRRCIDSLLQRPLEMRKALRAAPEIHFRADIIPAFLTQPTFLAGFADFKCDSITDCERS